MASDNSSVDKVLVSPETLQFIESPDPVDNSIKLSNFSDSNIVYRVRVSVQHVFVVPNNEGILNPDCSVNIQITMKPLSLFPDADLSRVKFAIEVAPIEEGDAYSPVKEVLSKYGNTLTRKSVLCDVTKVTYPETTDDIGDEDIRFERNNIAGQEDVTQFVPFQSNNTNTSPTAELNRITAETNSRNHNLTESLNLISQNMNNYPAPGPSSSSETSNGNNVITSPGSTSASAESITSYPFAASASSPSPAYTTSTTTNILGNFNKELGPTGRVLELMVKNVSRDKPLAQGIV